MSSWKIGCRDQLYFANISLCIFDEVASGYHLDGKFLEPRSDDSLDALAGNLNKQRNGSIARTFESQMLFAGRDMFDSYFVPKARARASKLLNSGSGPSRDQTARALSDPLKRALEDESVVRSPRRPVPALPCWHGSMAALDKRHAFQLTKTQKRKHAPTANVWCSLWPPHCGKPGRETSLFGSRLTPRAASWCERAMPPSYGPPHSSMGRSSGLPCLRPCCWAR